MNFISFITDFEYTILVIFIESIYSIHFYI